MKTGDDLTTTTKKQAQIVKKKHVRLSAISILHFWKFAYRTALLVLMLVLYILNKLFDTGSLFGGAEDNQTLLLVLWVQFVIGMVLRFFPSRLESMGCQKQFARNFRPKDGDPVPEKTPMWKLWIIIAFWVALNGTLGGLYLLGVYDAGILVLVSLAYSVCDMICILWFCPFHTWVLKNKCCTTCRIYNWDYAMIFTPLIFLPNVFSYTLVALSLVLLVKWEMTAAKHPERFAENSNACLDCKNCPEKLCHHKKQLQSYLKTWRKIHR